jgi:hypothetical protein
MVVVPLSKGENDLDSAPPDDGTNSTKWIRIAAAGTLAASGVLLLTGRRRAGLVAAVTGTVFAMVDQQETMCAWWDMLPGFLGDLQDLLSRGQTAIEDLSSESQKLRRALRR